MGGFLDGGGGEAGGREAQRQLRGGGESVGVGIFILMDGVDEALIAWERDVDGASGLQIVGGKAPERGVGIAQVWIDAIEHYPVVAPLDGIFLEIGAQEARGRRQRAVFGACAREHSLREIDGRDASAGACALGDVGE